MVKCFDGGSLVTVSLNVLSLTFVILFSMQKIMNFLGFSLSIFYFIPAQILYCNIVLYIGQKLLMLGIMQLIQLVHVLGLSYQRTVLSSSSVSVYGCLTFSRDSKE